jgi:hypothetical protein
VILQADDDTFAIIRAPHVGPGVPNQTRGPRPSASEASSPSSLPPTLTPTEIWARQEHGDTPPTPNEPPGQWRCTEPRKVRHAHDRRFSRCRRRSAALSAVCSVARPSPVPGASETLAGRAGGRWSRKGEVPLSAVYFDPEVDNVRHAGYSQSGTVNQAKGMMHHAHLYPVQHLDARGSTDLARQP